MRHVTAWTVWAACLLCQAGCRSVPAPVDVSEFQGPDAKIAESDHDRVSTAKHAAYTRASLRTDAAAGEHRKDATADASDCPCGPNWWGPLTRLIPQGFGSVDFRPACRQHDRCYDRRSGITRAECDRVWRDQMLTDCANSPSPHRCARRALLMYRMVRLFGWTAYGW